MKADPANLTGGSRILPPLEAAWELAEVLDELSTADFATDETDLA